MTLHAHTKWHYQAGTSLVEVMIACALGLFLISGFMQIYLATQKSFNLQQSLVFMQENARFASHFLNTNIRLAGYAGCDPTLPLTQPDLAIHGYHGTPPAFLQGKVLKGTDSVVIGRCYLQNGQTTFQQLGLFIGTTTRKNILGKPIYALYINPLGSDKSELVSNIDDMRIVYGLTNSNGQDITQYVDADHVTNWTQVRSVEIAFLLSSQIPVLPKPEAYEFAGTLFPGDRFLHRQWRIYIALRDIQ